LTTQSHGGSELSYVRYIDRTKAYYQAEGYEKPYQWANYDTVPFTPLKKPLAESRIALVSTSEIASHAWEDQRLPDEKGEASNVYGVAVDTPVEDLYSRTHSYDMNATTLDDVNSYFPVTRLQELEAEGRIGSLAPTAYGVYNAYSQSKTNDVDAPEVLRGCREEAVDIALLVPV
jgi:hypothetical protein